MCFSSKVNVGYLGALALLLVNCGGSGNSVGSGKGDGGQSHGTGGSGLSPSAAGGNGVGGASNADSLGDVLTISGTTGGAGSVDGPGRFGLLAAPEDMASDGSHLYITEDGASESVVSLDLATGVATTLAGSAKAGYDNGIGVAARFDGPSGIVIEPTHQYLYVADRQNDAIRKIVIDTGEVSTIAGDSLNPRIGSADGVGAAAAFYWPNDLTIDSKGHFLYVSDTMNHEIRAIDLLTNEVTTLAGSVTAGSKDGVGSAAAFNMLGSIVIDASDTTLYVADNQNRAIREIDIASRQVKSHPYFGEPDENGITRNYALSYMGGLTLDRTGKFLYITKTNGGAIRRLDLSTSTATLLAGNDQDLGFANGPGAKALFDFPEGLLLTDDGLLVADSGNDQVRKLDLSTNVVTSFAGSKSPASFSGPRGVTSVGNFLYVTDSRSGMIRKVVMSSGDATTLTDGSGSALKFTEPCGITTDGTYLYVADGNRNEISQVTIASGDVTVLAGSRGVSGAADGIGATASFNAPQGLTIDAQHQNLYIADQGNHQIRKLVIASGQVTTLAGTTESGAVDGVGAAARFNMPADVVVDAKGSSLYVSDGENNEIRKIELATAEVTTLAGHADSGNAYSDGKGVAAAFSKPWGMATDGTYVYFAGAGDNMIRRLELATNTVKTISGQYGAGATDGPGLKATFGRPEGMTLDATGSFLYVCDYSNNMIRRVGVK